MTTLKEKLLKKCEFDQSGDPALVKRQWPGAHYFTRGRLHERKRLKPILHTLIDVVERQRAMLSACEYKYDWVQVEQLLAECDELLKGVME